MLRSRFTRAAPTTVLSLLAAVVVAALAASWPLAPAVAGGPTSVLLSVPGEGRTTALYYTDPAYDRLARAVGAFSGETGEEVADGHITGTTVTITWLVHDVTPWRIDRVYVDADGAAWVLTQENATGGPLDTAQPVWHRGEAGLPRLLDRLLTEGDGDSGGTGSSALAPEPAATPDVTETAAAPRTDGSSPYLVGLAALGVGFAAGAGLTHVVRRRREQPHLAEPDVPVADQLVWP